MAKVPAFQFYPADWLRGTQLQMATLTSQGIWINLLCAMWWAPERGVLTGTVEELRRLVKANPRQFSQFLQDVSGLKFADLQTSDTSVTLISRRMVREEKARKSGAERQARMREKGGGNPERWTAIRVKILERDNHVCAYCGRRASTVDHIMPKAKGGDESDRNLVASCKGCNYAKNDRTMEECGMSFWKDKHLSDIVVASTLPLTPSTPSPKKELHCEADASRGDALEVLTWLNEKAQKNFRPSDTNVGLIMARLKGGILPGQLKAIVTRKCRQWSGDPEKAEYLRPATLFNKTKCEQYLGELPKLEEAPHGD